MKIRLLGAVQWDGEHREVGDVFEVSDFDAHTLIARGRAVPYTEPQEIDTNRAIGVKKSQPESVAKRRSYKRKPKASEY